MSPAPLARADSATAQDKRRPSRPRAASADQRSDVIFDAGQHRQPAEQDGRSPIGNERLGFLRASVRHEKAPLRPTLDEPEATGCEWHHAGGVRGNER